MSLKSHPRYIKRLIGHHQEKQLFEDSFFNNTLQHCWLLEGPSGIGKASFAYCAARAILYFLNKKNIKNIDIFATSMRREENLKKKFKFNRFLIRSTRLRKRYDLIINGSSAGMTKKNKINRNILNLVKNARGVIDIVYNPIDTDLLKKAKKHDIKYSGGLKMLVEQAKPSFEFWSNKDIQIDDKIYRSLIGMI